jgi:hypothetical protein
MEMARATMIVVKMPDNGSSCGKYHKTNGRKPGAI